MLADNPAMPVSSYRYRPTITGRLAAIGLALGVCALIIFLLIQMGWLDSEPGGRAGKLNSVTFQSHTAEKAEKKPAAKAERKDVRSEHAVQTPPTPQVVQPRPVPPMPLPFNKLTREEFAASDISTLGRRRPEDSSQAGADGGAAQGPGEGPGGAKLYNAEWYREPTRAELVTYMPRRDYAGGWAMIACKTIDHNHVEDCRELGESPPGSGLARGLRQAAWQFLVRPPRIDGKAMLGVWVRIRFDFRPAGPSEGPDAPDGNGG